MANFTPFPTVFGRGLLGEVKNIACDPYLIVTMGDIWSLPTILQHFPKEDEEDREAGGGKSCEREHTYFVWSLEAVDLEKDLSLTLRNIGYRTIIGLGGGQAMDVAKFFAWKLNVPLFQIPYVLDSLRIDN